MRAIWLLCMCYMACYMGSGLVCATKCVKSGLKPSQRRFLLLVRGRSTNPPLIQNHTQYTLQCVACSVTLTHSKPHCIPQYQHTAPTSDTYQNHLWYIPKPPLIHTKTTHNTDCRLQCPLQALLIDRPLRPTPNYFQVKRGTTLHSAHCTLIRHTTDWIDTSTTHCRHIAH